MAGRGGHPFKAVLDKYCSDAIVSIYDESAPAAKTQLLDALAATCEQMVLAGVRARGTEDYVALTTPTATAAQHAVIQAVRAASKSPLAQFYPPDSTLNEVEALLTRWGRTRPLRDVLAEAEYIRSQLASSKADPARVITTRSDTSVRKNAATHNYSENLRRLQRFEKIAVQDLRLFQTMAGKVLEGTIVSKPVGMVGLQVVMQDSTGQHLELGLYNQLETVDLAAAVALFPVGARICVVEPFLKVFRNGACGVRVDNPAEVMVFVDGPDAAAGGGGGFAAALSRLEDGGKAKGFSAYFDLVVAAVHQASAPGLGASGPIEHTEVSRMALLLSNQAQCYLHLGLPEFAVLKAAAALFLRPTVVVDASQGEDEAPQGHRGPRSTGAAAAPVDKAMQRYQAAVEKLRKGVATTAGGAKQHTDPTSPPPTVWRSDAIGRCAEFLARPHALYCGPGDDLEEELGLSLEEAHRAGNDAFRAGRHREALKAYQEGIVGVGWRERFVKVLARFTACCWELRLPDHVLAAWACVVSLLDFPTSEVCPCPRATEAVLAEVNPYAALALVALGDGAALAPALAAHVPESYAGIAELCRVVTPAPPPAYLRGGGEARTGRMYPFRASATAAHPLKDLLHYRDGHRAMFFTPSFGAAVDAQVLLPQWAHDAVDVRKTPTKGRGVFLREAVKAGDVVIVDSALVLGKSDAAKDKERHYASAVQQATITDPAPLKAEGAWVFRHGRDRYACRCAKFIHHAEDDRGNLRPLVQVAECFNHVGVRENGYAPFLCFETLEGDGGDDVVECGNDDDAGHARLPQLLSMLALNAFGDGDASGTRTVGLYPAISLVNHDGAHNAILCPLHMQTAPGREVALMVVATRDIAAGEELLICYTEDEALLKSKWRIGS